jgi:ribosomal-protein-alanine N-acetyltransferase
MSLATLRFQDLTPEAIPAILAIEQESNSSPWSEKSFRNELDNPHKIFLVAYVDGQVVGYGGIWLVVDEAHVTNIAVSPPNRKLGIGRRLMVKLLQGAQEAGMTCSTLEVRASNTAAIDLYLQLGYQETARRKRYYPDNQEDAVVMWLYDLQAWEAPRMMRRSPGDSEETPK